MFVVAKGYSENESNRYEYEFLVYDLKNGKHVTRLHNGKNLEKTSKRNRTDSTKKCHNRGLNPKHKVPREIGP